MMTIYEIEYNMKSHKSEVGKNSLSNLSGPDENFAWWGKSIRGFILIHLDMKEKTLVKEKVIATKKG